MLGLTLKYTEHSSVIPKMAEKNYSKLQLFAVLTILIIFPILSWVYLKAGLDYQRETRAELINYGQLPEFRFTNFKGIEFNRDSIKSEMAVLSFIGENEDYNKTMLKMMQQLHEQFGKSNNLQFLVMPLLRSKASSSYLQNLANEYELNDEVQHHFLSGIVSNIQLWLGEQIKVPVEKQLNEKEVPLWKLESNSSQQINDYPFFVLVDTAHTIRNYYNYTNYDEVRRMVEHIAIILPQPKERDAIIKREQEK